MEKPMIPNNHFAALSYTILLALDDPLAYNIANIWYVQLA